MKMSKLSIIAMLAISFGFFSCNEEESLIIPQNSNEKLRNTTAESLELDTTKHIGFKLVASPKQIGKNGGDSYLSGVITVVYPGGTFKTEELPNMVYTGSAPGFTLGNNKVTAAPMPDNTVGRSIDIVGRGIFEGKVYEARVTIHQEGTATSSAWIDGKTYIGDQTIYLSPGVYECYAGYADGRFAKETWVMGVDGPGVWADMPHGPIHVGPDADAVVTLQAILPGLPTSHLHIKAK